MCEQFSDCSEHFLRNFVPDSFFEVISMWRVIILVFDVILVCIASRIITWRRHILDWEKPEKGMTSDEIEACIAEFPCDGILSSEKCAVCQEQFEYGEDVCMLHCLHAYHKDCLSQWLKDHSRCPNCRRNVERIVT